MPIRGFKPQTIPLFLYYNEFYLIIVGNIIQHFELSGSMEQPAARWATEYMARDIFHYMSESLNQGIDPQFIEIMTDYIRHYKANIEDLKTDDGLYKAILGLAGPGWWGWDKPTHLGFKKLEGQFLIDRLTIDNQQMNVQITMSPTEMWYFISNLLFVTEKSWRSEHFSEIFSSGSLLNKDYEKIRVEEQFEQYLEKEKLERSEWVGLEEHDYDYYKTRIKYLFTYYLHIRNELDNERHSVWNILCQGGVALLSTLLNHPKVYSFVEDIVNNIDSYLTMQLNWKALILMFLNEIETNVHVNTIRSLFYEGFNEKLYAAFNAFWEDCGKEFNLH